MSTDHKVPRRARFCAGDLPRPGERSHTPSSRPKNGTRCGRHARGSCDDYIYGPTGEPIEQVNVTSSPPTNNPTFMTYTPSNSSWLITNTAGDQTSYYRYDAFGTLAVGTPGSPFGYAGQYQDTGTGASGFDNMRARWYDGQTGEFTTRDPAFNSTDQPYSYANDDPVNSTDPTGKFTVGVCGNLSAQIAIIGGLGGTGTLCLVRTLFTPGGNDDIGVTETAGASAPGLGAAAGGALEYQVSNANHLQDLAHHFTNVVTAIPLTLGIGVGANAEVFVGKGADSQNIYGAQLGLSFGGGGGAFVYDTNTWVQQVRGTVPANVLRIIWDALVPPPLVLANNLDAILSAAQAKSKTALAASPTLSPIGIAASAAGGC